MVYLASCFCVYCVSWSVGGFFCVMCEVVLVCGAVFLVLFVFFWGVLFVQLVGVLASVHVWAYFSFGW